MQAFTQIEEALTKQQRWPELEQAYVRMIQRLPKTPDAAQARLALWKTLGDLHRNVLRNDDGARTAYQVVARSDPEDAVARLVREAARRSIVTSVLAGSAGFGATSAGDGVAAAGVVAGATAVAEAVPAGR